MTHLEALEKYVTETRLMNVLTKVPHNTSIKQLDLIVKAMIEDIYNEEGVVEDKFLTKLIEIKTIVLFKEILKPSKNNNE